MAESQNRSVLRSRFAALVRENGDPSHLTILDVVADALTDAGVEIEAAKTLEEMHVDELEALCDERGIDRSEIEGSGKDGAVVKADLVAAIERQES